MSSYESNCKAPFSCLASADPTIFRWKLNAGPLLSYRNPNRKRYDRTSTDLTRGDRTAIVQRRLLPGAIEVSSYLSASTSTLKHTEAVCMLSLFSHQIYCRSNVYKARLGDRCHGYDAGPHDVRCQSCSLHRTTDFRVVQFGREDQRHIRNSTMLFN